LENVENPDSVEVAENEKKKDRNADFLAWGLMFLCLLILLLYLFVSDLHPVGEFLTIWPPVLYFVPSAVVAIPFLFKASKYPRIGLGVSLLLFFIILIEWGSLLRGLNIFSSEPEGDQYHRIVTWNIGGGHPGTEALMNEIENWQPDIVCFQESTFRPDELTSKSLKEYYHGFEYVDSGDCGILSRWPVTVLETESIGPWDKPQIVRIDIDPETKWLVINVRLMLPSLILNPFDRTAREKLWHDNEVRREQYTQLISLIDKRVSEDDYDTVILTGDFNTEASAKSLNIFNDEFEDAWKQSGVGWGGTVTNQFPAARFDFIFLQKGESVWTEVLDTEFSDHRPVLSVIKTDNP